ncbi:MAG: PAS domain S-box protein [Desulfobacteraceae bacterium]
MKIVRYGREFVLNRIPRQTPEWISRGYTLFFILSLVIVFGALTLVPSIISAIQEEKWISLSALSGAYATVLIILFKKNLSYYVRSYILCFCVAVAGYVSISSIGLISSARLWFLCSAVLACLLIGGKSAFVIFLISFIVFVGFGYKTDFAINLPSEPDHIVWIITSATFILVNILVVGATYLIVSGLKKAESSLRESEERFRLFAELAPIGIILSDRQENTLYVSPKFTELFGYTISDIPSVNQWWSLAYPDEELGNRVRREWKTAIDQAMKSRHEIKPMEFPMTCKDGTVRQIEFRIRATDDLNVIVFSDVTERKKAEEKLHRDRRFLNQLMETSPVAITVVNREGQLKMANAMAEKTLGFNRSNLYNRIYNAPEWHITDYNGNNFPNEKLPFQIVKETGSAVFGIEHAIEWPDGRRVLLSVNSAPLFDGNGDFDGSVSAIENVTERKEAEEKLRKSEAHLEEAQRIAHVGSWNWIAATDTPTWSRELCRILEVDPDKPAPSMTDQERLYTPESIESLKDSMEKTMQTGEPYEVELECVLENDSRRWLLSRGERWHDEQGKIIGLRGTALDITERKRAEAEKEKLQNQISQAHKMESVGRLAGGVAHDFNNMLGVILGHAEFALEKAEEHHDLYADLKEIQTAAQRSADLTRQLLAFARKQTISPRKLDLNDTVESMLNMLRRLIGEDIDLVWQPAAHIWSVKMDPSQIDQILANLCVNARDAISGVGKLTIETGIKTFDEEYCNEHAGFIPGDFVLLAVSDNGCGMDKETLDNLFEPFFTNKEVGKGTGLGLATIYGIVKQNDGFINVYSEPGQGSTFKIYLPRFVGDEETDMGVPEKKPAAGGTETILLVEDEPTILRMTRMMLEKKGYTVISAVTPTEAIEKARNHSNFIDLLMTDVVMPEMNGRDLAGQIAELYPGIRNLFMSGYTANVIAHQGVLDDGVAFIQKPFSMADMTEKVRDILDTARD